MKINDKIPIYEVDKCASKSSSRATEAVEKRQPSVGQRTEGKDPDTRDTVVNLSQTSKEAQKILEALSSAPDIREEKVAACRKTIESGDYKIDHMGVAEKLVDYFKDEIS